MTKLVELGQNFFATGNGSGEKKPILFREEA